MLGVLVPALGNELLGLLDQSLSFQLEDGAPGSSEDLLDSSGVACDPLAILKEGEPLGNIGAKRL
eukprot:2628268-Alexandrium_andersonii.AAC.1